MDERRAKEKESNKKKDFSRLNNGKRESDKNKRKEMRKDQGS